MQMRRAAVSVPCNIAEGQGRSTPKDYRHFVLQARGSVLELRTQIVISEELGFIEPSIRNELKERADEVGRMLNGLLRYLTPKAYVFASIPMSSAFARRSVNRSTGTGALIKYPCI
jgi:four helix bundle protein